MLDEVVVVQSVLVLVAPVPPPLPAAPAMKPKQELRLRPAGRKKKVSYDTSVMGSPLHSFPGCLPPPASFSREREV